MDILINWHISINQPFSKVPVSICNIDPAEEVDFAILQALCRLNNERNAPSVPFEGKIYSIGGNFFKGDFGKYNVSIESIKTLHSSKDLPLLNKFGPTISHFLGKLNGFDKKEGNKIFGGIPAVTPTLRIYNGILSKTRILPSGNVITSIDSTKRWIQTLDQYIASFMTRGHPKGQILAELEGSTVSCPSYLKRCWFDAKIKRFTDMRRRI